jgi:general secretion pathway protein B
LPAEDPKTDGRPEKPSSIRLISELPFDVREKLGKLQINVHSYSENPAERLVFINMQNLKVGDRIGENGPILKEITPEGVIIDYGEGQARVPVSP